MKRKHNCVIVTLVLFASIPVVASPATAGHIVYQETFTGQALDNQATFPTLSRNRSLFGTSLNFGAGTTVGDTLFDLALFGAGTLEDGGVVSIQIEGVFSGDNDPTLGITDGTNFIGLVRADNSGGSGILRLGTVSGSIVSTTSTYELFTNAGILNSFQADITINTADTHLVGQIGSTTGSFSSVITKLNFNNAYRLIMLGDDPWETYQVNFVSITATNPGPAHNAVPEPPALVLLAVGVVGIFSLGVRRELFSKRVLS